MRHPAHTLLSMGILLACAEGRPPSNTPPSIRQADMDIASALRENMNANKKQKKNGGFDLFGFMKSSAKEKLEELDRQAKAKVSELTGKEYEAGDLSKWMDQQAKAKVNQLTGKDAYEAGDLVKWMDKEAKAKVMQLKGKAGQEYKNEDFELGDLALWADATAKEMDAHAKSAANKFTGKQGEYELGDISRTISKRISTGEYRADDVYLAFRLLINAGISISPLAGILPVKLLLAFLNVGVAKDMSGRMMEEIAKQLESRVKEAMFGNFQLPSFGKDELSKALAQFTGSDDYKDGDISTAVSGFQRRGKAPPKLALEGVPGFDKWDSNFLKREIKKK